MIKTMLYYLVTVGLGLWFWFGDPFAGWPPLAIVAVIGLGLWGISSWNRDNQHKEVLDAIRKSKEEP
jgi:hypothetical protein